MAARSGGRVDGGQWQRLAVCLAEGGRHVRLERPWSRRPGAGGWSGMWRRSGERRPGKGKVATCVSRACVCVCVETSYYVHSKELAVTTKVLTRESCSTPARPRCFRRRRARPPTAL